MAAPLVGVLVVVALLLATAASPDGPPEPTGTPVDLDRPSAAPPEAADEAPPAVCTLADGTATCGDILVDDRAAVTSIAALGPDAVLVARRGGEVRRIDLPAGRQRWSVVPFPGSDGLELRTEDGPILALRPGAIARLDPSSGRVRWDQRLGDPTMVQLPRTLAVDGGILVLAADGTLTSLHAETGEVRWQRPTSGASAIPTGAGFVIVGTDGSELWHPDHGRVWQRVAPLTPRPGPRGERADGPLPLLSDQGLLVVSSGEHLMPPLGGPTLRRVAGPVTLHLRWTDRRSALDVTAYGPDGGVAWTRRDLEVTCCHASVVPADGGRVAIATADTGAVLLSLATGDRLASLPTPLAGGPASLLGVAGDLALWHTPDGTIGTSLDGTELRLTLGDDARVVSLEPLLVAGPVQVVVLEDLLTRPEERPFPGLPAGSGSGRT